MAHRGGAGGSVKTFLMMEQGSHRGPGSASSRVVDTGSIGPPRLVKGGNVVASQPLPFYLRPQPLPDRPESLRPVALPPRDGSVDIDELVGSAGIRFGLEESWMEPADRWLRLGFLRHY